jgi:hypothetical protein
MADGYEIWCERYAIRAYFIAIIFLFLKISNNNMADA